MSATLKTALVTGAGSGIGRGIAKTLDSLGLRLALIGRDESKLGHGSIMNGGCDSLDGDGTCQPG